MQTQLRDESLDTPITPEANGSIEDLGVHPNVGVE